jgi:hypothetical protein
MKNLILAFTVFTFGANVAMGFSEGGKSYNSKHPRFHSNTSNLLTFRGAPTKGEGPEIKIGNYTFSKCIFGEDEERVWNPCDPPYGSCIERDPYNDKLQYRACSKVSLPRPSNALVLYGKDQRGKCVMATLGKNGLIVNDKNLLKKPFSPELRETGEGYSCATISFDD